MRRTVVLIYDEGTRNLDWICSIQQRKITLIEGGEDGGNLSFDGSDIDEMDLSVMPKTAPFDLGEVRTSRRRRKRSRLSDGRGGGKERRVEILTVLDGTYRDEEGGTKDDDEDGFLADLLGCADKEEDDNDDDEILRIALPNGVFLACPWSVSTKEEGGDYDDDNYNGRRSNICMGYRRESTKGERRGEGDDDDDNGNGGSKGGEVQIIRFEMVGERLEEIRANWIDVV